MSKRNDNTDLNWIIKLIKRNVRKDEEGKLVLSGPGITPIIAKL